MDLNRDGVISVEEFMDTCRRVSIFMEILKKPLMHRQVASVAMRAWKMTDFHSLCVRPDQPIFFCLRVCACN